MALFRIIIIILFAACAANLSAPKVSAALRVDEYLNRVESAREAILEMKADLFDSTGKLPHTGFYASKVVRVRELLPLSLSIETGNGRAAADHLWLHSGLDSFVTETGIVKRMVILTGLEERLASIAWTLSHRSADGPPQTTKDEVKRKLEQILAREEFRKQAEEQSRFEKWLAGVLEWLEGLFPSTAPGTQKAAGMPWLASVLQVVLLGAVIALLGYGLFRLAPVIFPSIRRRRPERNEARVVLGERLGEESTAADLLAEAEALAKHGDLRGAVRKAYIAILCELSERKLIGLARHKTNRDYLRDLRREAMLHAHMSALTGIFERQWYGRQDPEPGAWERFRAGYREAVQGISNVGR